LICENSGKLHVFFIARGKQFLGVAPREKNVKNHTVYWFLAPSFSVIKIPESGFPFYGDYLSDNRQGFLTVWDSERKNS
jgi:hypothetical protein